MNPYVEKKDLTALPFLRSEMEHVSPYVLDEPLGAGRMHQNECAPLTNAEKEELAAEAQRIVLSERSLNTYPSVDPTRLRDAMAHLYGVTSACVEPTSGSSQAISLVALACFEKGKTVAIVDPSFSLYASLAKLHGANVKSISLNRDDFEYTLESLLAARDADVLILCNPNNPTGSVLPAGAVEQLLSLTKGLVVVDEAYIEFCPEIPSVCSLVEKHTNLLVLRTLSKAWGLAGLRLGALVGHPDLIRVFRALKNPYSFSSLTEQLGLFALTHWQQGFAGRIEKIRQEQQAIRRGLEGIGGVRFAPSNGNFVCFVHPLVYSLERALREKDRVLIRIYGSADHKSHHLFGMARVSVWSPESNQLFLEKAQHILSGKGLE